MNKRNFKFTLLVMCIVASLVMGSKLVDTAQAATVKTNKSGAAKTETITVKQPQKLIKKSLGYKSVKLQWSKVSGVTGYVVYRYNPSTKKYDTKCLATKKNTVIIDKLVQGGAYSFVVKAYKKVDKKNYYSKNSNVVKIVTVPNKVSKLTISNVKDTSLKISWSKATGANLYYVYSYNAKKNKYTRLLSTTNTYTNITGLTPGSTYIFVVKSCAQTKDGLHKTNGALSPKTYAYTAPSIAKGLVQSGLTDTSISIKWNEAKGADGYKIYRYNPSKNKGTLLKKVSASTKTYTQTGLKAGTEYCYAVRSYAKFGDNEVNAVSFESRYGITKPGKVTGLKVTDETDDSIKLSWSKVSGADGYYVYKYNDKTNKYTNVKTTESISYTATDLEGFTSYKYMIKAYSDYRYNSTHYLGTGTTISAKTELGTSTDIEVTNISTNSITYKWAGVNNATGYIITVEDAKGNILETKKVLKEITSYTYETQKDEIINVKVTVQPYATVITVNNGEKKDYFGGKISLTSSNVLSKVEGMEQFSCELNSIGIAWEKVDLAEKYEIYKLSGESYVKIGESTTCEYVIDGLKAGTVCNIKVRAVISKDGQTLRGDYSDNFECISMYGTVDGEVAEACFKYVKITWNKVSTADGYKVYKYNDTSKTYELKKTITSANTNTYTDNSVSSGKTYMYKVIVYKDIDGLLNESEMGTAIVAKIGVYGIDVSQYQKEIDWTKVKAAGVDYAIIRATKYKSNGENGTNLTKDDKFDQNMTNAIKAGVKVGVYVYSYADSVAEAKKEAQFVISLVKNYKLSYPIYFDIEDPARKQTSYKTENTNMSIAFCDAVKAAGYKPGVYSGASFFVSYLNVSSLSKYDIWVARYLYSDKTFSFPGGIADINKCIDLGYTYNNKYTSIDADMWQYTSSGVVAGIPGRVDMNYGYKSY